MKSIRIMGSLHLRRLRPLPLASLALLAGCAVGPDYQRPSVATPAAFKEAGDWKPATPSDGQPRTAWWEVYNDSVLNDLEEQVARSNLSLQAQAAAYEQARQLARSDNATLLPTIAADGSATRSKSPSGRTSASGVVGGSGATNNYSASLVGSWEPDFWGRIRRLTESDMAVAQQDAANFANARLSLQATLAQDYIGLRILDEKKRLLDSAADDYRRTLEISKNKYSVGVSARSDVSSAQARLDSTRAQAIDVGVQRAALEHAIAVLVGKPPEDFSVAVKPTFDLGAPAIPLAVPSDLLQRRPDIASAERALAEANAKVGIQTAAYFPALTLSAQGGFEGSDIAKLFTAPYRFWSIGASATESLFDYGERHDLVLAAKAAYQGSVATYRGTVLTAFQQVEDDLAAIRILATEADVQQSAVNEAADASKIAQNEYKAGTVDYTTVVTAQVEEVNDRESALSILQSRLDASVALIQALGGGWSAADLPDSHQVFRDRKSVV